LAVHAQLFSRRKGELPEFHLAVVALDQERARFFFVAVERAAGDARDGLTFDNGFAIENDVNDAANEGDFEGLPFAGFFGGVNAWSEVAINAADEVAFGFEAEIIFDLHFVTAAQVNAAVGVFRVAEFGAQFEIGEFAFGEEIVAGVSVGEKTVANLPAVFGICAAGFPASEVVAVEEFDRLTPFRCVIAHEGGRAVAFPRDGVAGVVRNRAAQGVAFQCAFDNDVVGAVFPLGRDHEMEVAGGLVKFNVGDGSSAAELADVGTHERVTAGQFDLDPRGVCVVAIVDRQIPAAEERLAIESVAVSSVNWRRDNNKERERRRNTIRK